MSQVEKKENKKDVSYLGFIADITKEVEKYAKFSGNVVDTKKNISSIAFSDSGDVYYGKSDGTINKKGGNIVRKGDDSLSISQLEILKDGSLYFYNKEGAISKLDDRGQEGQVLFFDDGFYSYFLSFDDGTVVHDNCGNILICKNQVKSINRTGWMSVIHTHIQNKSIYKNKMTIVSSDEFAYIDDDKDIVIVNKDTQNIVQKLRLVDTILCVTYYDGMIIACQYNGLVQVWKREESGRFCGNSKQIFIEEVGNYPLISDIEIIPDDCIIFVSERHMLVYDIGILNTDRHTVDVLKGGRIIGNELGIIDNVKVSKGGELYSVHIRGSLEGCEYTMYKWL